MFGEISTICEPSERELSAKPHVYPKLAGGLLCAAIFMWCSVLLYNTFVQVKNNCGTICVCSYTVDELGKPVVVVVEITLMAEAICVFIFFLVFFSTSSSPNENDQLCVKMFKLIFSGLTFLFGIYFYGNANVVVNS